MNSKIKNICRLSLIAGMYVVLTIINPFSYDAIQFRISEILLFLCFFKKDYSIALIIGCFIANLFSPLLLYDLIFGTLATILTCLFMSHSKNIYIATLYPIVFNAIIIGFELYLAMNTLFIINFIYVFIGEAVVILFGLIIFNKLKKSNKFLELIDSEKF